MNLSQLKNLKGFLITGINGVKKQLLRVKKKKLKYKFKIGDKVIFVNDFGVVYLWSISVQTTWELIDGSIIQAYNHEGTQTPWFPTKESDLRIATKIDHKLNYQQLQQKYGFIPTEWYGCY